jgi:hypothetical protein
MKYRVKLFKSYTEGKKKVIEGEYDAVTPTAAEELFFQEHGNLKFDELRTERV